MDFHPNYFSELKKYNGGHKKMNDELMIDRENNDFIVYLKDEGFNF